MGCCGVDEDEEGEGEESALEEKRCGRSGYVPDACLRTHNPYLASQWLTRHDRGPLGLVMGTPRFEQNVDRSVKQVLKVCSLQSDLRYNCKA
jgi:hypothetical protein